MNINEDTKEIIRTPLEGCPHPSPPRAAPAFGSSSPTYSSPSSCTNYIRGTDYYTLGNAILGSPLPENMPKSKSHFKN